MSPFDFLMGAAVNDIDGNKVGEIVGMSYIGGKLALFTDLYFEEEEDDPDPDPGEEEDEEFAPSHLKLVGKIDA